MIIQYNIVLTIVNLINNGTSKFNKIFEAELKPATDVLLYNNYHILSQGVYVLDMFEDEVNAYCTALGIEKSSIEIDEFEIVSLTDRTEVFFESDKNDNSLSLKPIIKCYVHPKNDALKVPGLVGIAYDSNTIIWSWPEDEQYAHYLVEEAIDPDSEADKDKIVAQLPIGATSYTETGLEPDTSYTRRLINYTDEQTSAPSPSVTIMTDTVQIQESLEEYSVPRNYDFITDDSERELIQENLEAFHSGVGDHNDLKVYKQMDADFYQKFKAYFELTGRRIQREKRYDQVGFNYKICLEAIETIEEQEGEVTFDLDVYPREWVAIQDYMWATMPVKVLVKFRATVFLRKESPEEEYEEVILWEPSYNLVDQPPITEIVGNPLNLIIVWDTTMSMYFTAGGYRNGGGKAGQAAARANIDSVINMMSNKISHIQEAGNSLGVKVNVILCTFNSGHGSYIGNWNPDKIYAQNNQYHFSNTSWREGGNHGAKGIRDYGSMGNDSKTIVLFVSDGADNTVDKNNAGSIAKEILRAAGADQIVPVLARVTVSGPNYAGFKGPEGCIGGGGGNITDGLGNAQDLRYNAEVIAWENHEELMEKIESCFNALVVTTPQPSINVFGGWKQKPETTVGINKYNIDFVKAVEIESDQFVFEFNNKVTPEKYIRAEKRTIIPLSSFLEGSKLSQKNLYDLIMEKVEQTNEYKSGYQLTIGTVEPNSVHGSSDSFLIQGLFIKDSYEYADEDNPLDNNDFGWGVAWNDLEDGMEGTVNAYTDINKVGTTYYGDDCYLVSKDNYLMIQGYTDGIIYDGTRYVRTELNFYNYPSEILVSALGDYRNYLFNRKKPSLVYTGPHSLSHVIDILEKDKDIFFTGYPELVKVGDWLLIAPLTVDFVAHIETMHESPVLNYRFNLEDPDAKTPFYEILPTCDPDSNYLNIVILHVYYAKNVYITNINNYVAAFGTDPIATTSSSYIPLTQGLYIWSLMEWKDGVGKDNGRYIDEWLWFLAKPMFKTQDYYDELPGPGMDTFYGLVNGRYRTDNQDGKKNLIVDTPQFNIPTTVHKDTIKIYIMITEFYPEDALVSYKWEHPWNNKDGITMVNGDYVTFSSDSLTYKDVEYYDIIATLDMANQEVFNHKTIETIYQLLKPETIYKYKNYYLEVTTDNSDVLAMRYPTEIIFDENNIASVGVSFKGVVNATSRWSPRIHNGYYYLNQHEHYAYSEFDVKANFDTYQEVSFKTINGYISFDVQLRHKAKPVEHYNIIKDTRSELLQNEEDFQWIDKKGLTLKPIIDGEYYREYVSSTYYSPIILFPNVLTEVGVFKVSYYFEDGSEYLPMQIRSYNVDTGKWFSWEQFTNNTIPSVPLSCGYQVKFDLQASVQNMAKDIEDYMCCYLDWKDDMNEANTTNIVTITDHMTTGPDKADGIYISRVIDFGCETELMLDMFYSNYKSNCQLFISFTSNHPDRLLLENVEWYPCAKNNAYKGRYFRYKIIVPYNEKLYWLHKRIRTLETHELLPYVTGIAMKGTYSPSDVVINFINTESFEIRKDGEQHVIFERVIDVIGADVLERGYTEAEIEYINIQCTTKDIMITFDKNILNQYPTPYLSTSISAMSNIDYEILVKNTPYIFVEKDDDENSLVVIEGTPQQYCPIAVEDVNGNSFLQLHNTESFIIDEQYLFTERTKYIQLKENRYDPDNFNIYLDDELFDPSNYTIENHLVVFNDFIEIGHTLKVSYCILYSFIALIDRINNTTKIYIHTGEGIEVPDKVKVYFETSTKNNKFIAGGLSLNPIYRTDYNGFIYLTDEHNEPYRINIYCNPLILKAGGYDKVDISIEILDIKDNPIISKNVAVDCNYGILNCDSYVTDMNGVIHIVYESAYLKCTDKLTARVLKDDNSAIEQYINIINE